MSHKFVKVGDVVKIKKGDSEKSWSKLNPAKKYIVKKTSPHTGYEDDTHFITQFEDDRSNIINLKINERYFDVVWEDNMRVMKTKFAVGDQVISIKNTPSIPEGFIGTVAEINTGSYPIAVTSKDGQYSVFEEDELELLSVGGKEKIEQLKEEARIIFDGLVDKDYPFNLDDITPQDIAGVSKAEYTGGSSSYYKVDVANPTTSDAPYQAECNDVIEALGLTFTEGNIFKAIWRIAADRQGKKKKGNNSVYDAEKVVFFAERLLIQEKIKEGK